MLSGCQADFNSFFHRFQIPILTRQYPPCTQINTCVVTCSVSSVARAQLSWYNGSSLFTSLTISNGNTKIYLEVKYQDKNHYSCEVSNSGVRRTTYLNVSRLCQSCSGRTDVIVYSADLCRYLRTQLLVS